MLLTNAFAGCLISCPTVVLLVAVIIVDGLRLHVSKDGPSNFSSEPLLNNVSEIVSQKLNNDTVEWASQTEAESTRGRSIVSSISEQATNFGKGLLNLFRGSSGWRSPMPYQGPSRLRPYHNAYGPPSRGPLPYLNLPPPGSVVSDPDRMGPNFWTDSLQGGFLPSKKTFGTTNYLPQSSSSTVINTTKVMLTDPKAPCDYYTDSLCIESHPYPDETFQKLNQMELARLRQMIVDVPQNANVLVDGVTVQEEALYTYDHYYGSKDNNTHSYRDYGTDGGYVCPSDVKYVQLKRAKNAKGKWKIIVNFGDFIQTLRLEKCLKPYSRCSYVFSYLKSECVQIYNYQRLASWDLERGFHFDIYKVPTSCSCHLKSSTSELGPESKGKQSRISDTAQKNGNSQSSTQHQASKVMPIQSTMNQPQSTFHSDTSFRSVANNPYDPAYKRLQPKSALLPMASSVQRGKDTNQMVVSLPANVLSASPSNDGTPNFRRGYRDLVRNESAIFRPGLDLVVPQTAATQQIPWREKSKWPTHSAGKFMNGPPASQKGFDHGVKEYPYAYNSNPLYPLNDHLKLKNAVKRQRVNYHYSPASGFLHP